MKKIRLSIVALFVLFAIGCSKDNIIDNYKSVTINSEINSDNSLSSQTISNVKNEGEILHFKDMESFKSAYKILEEIQNSEISSYSKKYVKLTDDEIEVLTSEDIDKLNITLDKIDKEIGYTETNMLKQFEKKINFKSLRSEIEKKSNDWLINDGDNIENDPLMKEFILDEFTQTFLNLHREIIIGNSIYILLEYGYLEITDTNKETMISLRGNYSNYTKYTNVVAHFEGEGDSNNTSNKTSTSCYTNIHNIGYHVNSFNNKRRIKWYLSIWSFPWGTHVKTEVRSQKKFGWSWSNYKSSLDVSLQGQTVYNNNDCSGSSTVTASNGGYASHKAAVKTNVNKVVKRYNTYYSPYHPGIEGAFRGAGFYYIYKNTLH